MYPHIPVLLNEVLEYLEPGRGGTFLDGTVGLGGHSEAILKAGSSRLIGLDKDSMALELARKRLAPFGESAHLENMAFSDFATLLEKLSPEGVDGALLDLGISSMQLDTPERGFSFLHDGPLDMRMNSEGKLAAGTQSALELIENVSYEELRRIILEYGEEPMAGPIARAIISARNDGIETPLSSRG
jgi:Predicted S-adenosylmethionine-dependent methyltransferase involved in cell envelope biogenesis